MNILTGIANRGRRLLLAAAVVATVGMVAIHARPASADYTNLDTGTVLTLGKPDLTLTMTDVNFNGQGWMKIVVTNQGYASAGAFQVAVSDGYSIKQTFSVAGLGINQSTTLWHQLPKFSCGAKYTRYAMADSGNVISESNEFNNTDYALFIYPVC